MGDFNEEQVSNNYFAEQTEDKWIIAAEKLEIFKDPIELVREDLVGKQFLTFEDAEFFIHQYSNMIGFSLRKGKVKRQFGGAIKYRQWVCSKEGHRELKWIKNLNRKREPRAITREFRPTHSHPLVIAGHRQFIRSNRIIPDGMLMDATCMKSAGIKTCQIYSYMAELVGSYGKLSFLPKDLYNRVAKKESVHLKNADAARAIGYFQHKADHDVDCFCRFSYDGNNRLLNVMWADSKSREDYHLFGHSVAFDSTYKTNAYGKPLLVWLGVNNHFRSTIFGFALLSDESSDTYTWATKTCIDCMGGVTPKTVVTDGDPAIRLAINVTMPEVVHRLCYWHIHKKAAIAVKDPETRDAKDDYDTMNTMPLLQQTNMAHIEEEAAKLYTRNMFFRVRAQIEKEARYMVDSSTKEDDMVVVRLTKTPLFDTLHRTVYLDLSTGSIVTSIPKSLVITHWTIHAREVQEIPDESSTRCSFTCRKDKIRFGNISTQLYQISFLACTSDNLLNLAKKELEQLMYRLQKNSLEEDGYEEPSQCDKNMEYDLNNPRVSKNKGTGKVAGTSRQVRKRKCSKCGMYGHNKTTCNENREENINNSDLDISNGEGAYEDCNIWEDNEHNGVSEEEFVFDENIKCWEDANQRKKETPQTTDVDQHKFDAAYVAEERKEKDDTETIRNWWGAPYGTHDIQ
ncbi:hypothetical protein F8388_004699 [Cannabis sativa]|uniref:MULE transposase domain-containing protein n=1 Tax=Cannabis sativa TaxID=3483 RepID=A0A7J6HPB9_CANSA|nr:hypothetical protein F8388_004699 [Cannabis sativa]